MPKPITCNNAGGNWNELELAKGLVKTDHKTTSQFVIYCLKYRLVPTITELRKFLVTEKGYTIQAAEFATK